MTENNKARVSGKDVPQKSDDSQNPTGSDPLLGWFNLPKLSRHSQQKKLREVGKQCRRIDSNLAAQLALLIVLFVLIVGGGQA